MAANPDLSALRIDRDKLSDDEPGGKRCILWLSLVAVALAGGVWYFVEDRPPEVRVSAAAVTGGAAATAADSITANGYVVARTHASVATKLVGSLTSLRVHEGSHVRKNEVIATIEDQDYKAAVVLAKAAVFQAEVQLQQAKNDLVRARELIKEKFIAVTDLETAETREAAAQSALDMAKAQIQVAEANLSFTQIRAPFAGTVLRKDAEVGELVSPYTIGAGLARTSIVTMADLDTLEVEVDVNEAYIATIAQGQKARIILDAYPDVSFAGEVRQVVPTADRQKATVQVKVSILDHDPRILPDMGAKVNFLKNGDPPAGAAQPRRVTLPAAALVAGPHGQTAWVVDGGKVRSHDLEVGETKRGDVEVKKGLAGGESVVVNPPSGLKDGESVRVKKE